MGEFRKDIQCLRGLSLLFVFLYHYNRSLLPTGFIGVDIFFLISGYVNTLSFLSKHSNVIKLFYINRLKRIFPVSHLTLFVSIYLTKRMSLLYQNKQLKDIIYALFSLSNYRFVYLSIDYLSQTEPPSLVLHYWSLAIEDQFYLFFPFFISFIFKNIIYLIIIIVASFFYGCYMNINHHYISYFALLSRIWQLLLGAFMSKRVKVFKIKFINDFLIIFIILFCVMVKSDIYFPSPLSLFPLITVYFLLSNRNSSIILDNKVLLIFGNISYSFYLIHFLVICYFKDESKNVMIFFTIFFTTLIPSYIINKFYENPVRKINNTSAIFGFFGVSFISIISICFVFMNRNINSINQKYKIENSSNNKTVSPISNNYEKYTHIKSNKVIYSPDTLKKTWRDFQSSQCKCQLKSKSYIAIANEYPIVLLLTDSHGEQWFNTIVPYARKMNYVAIHVWFWVDKILNKRFDNLYKIFNLIPKVNYVVSAHYLTEKSNTSLLKLNYFFYLEILLKHCDEIYVIHDTPHFKDDPNMCLLSTSNYDNCYSYIGKNGSQFFFPIYQNSKVHYINMLPFICQDSYKCYYIWNSIPIYMDNNHLSLQFSQTLSLQLLKYLHFEKQTKKDTLNCSLSFRCDYIVDI